jgi:hypothetical protein
MSNWVQKNTATEALGYIQQQKKRACINLFCIGVIYVVTYATIIQFSVVAIISTDCQAHR